MKRISYRSVSTYRIEEPQVRQVLWAVLLSPSGFKDFSVRIVPRYGTRDRAEKMSRPVIASCGPILRLEAPEAVERSSFHFTVHRQFNND